jgi:hypothetical protein
MSCPRHLTKGLRIPGLAAQFSPILAFIWRHVSRSIRIEESSEFKLVFSRTASYNRLQAFIP